MGYRWKGSAWVASDGSADNFSFSEENTPTYRKYNDQLQIEGWITAAGVLAPKHDAAQVQWGEGWRMPTDQELGNLINSCDWTWTTMNGVNGYVVRGKGDFADASIFVPAAGYGYGTSLEKVGWDGFIWSSIPHRNDDGISLGLLFGSRDCRIMNASVRFCGRFVRPVQGATK